MADAFTSLFNFLSQIAGTNQFALVFLVSLFGNIIPVIPIPYLLIVIAVILEYPSLGIVQIAAVSALGAATGKFVSYVLGYGVRSVSRRNQKRFDSLRRLLGGSIFLVAFIFAATPLPDDVAFIPMGIMRYSPVKTYISLYTGKFVLNLFVLYTARSSEAAIREALGGGVEGSIASVVIIILLSYLMMRIDWERVLTETKNRSFRRLLARGWI
ncbi:MAG TPA: VTT domain-containing protein, partial [Candidatus Binatus sp.]|nr:VTT domain-containing protein [Candidatus Binatus sp.]